jgi:hypothetical protein
MFPAPIPGFESKSTTVGGIRLHYWTGGDPTGQPVILWHGFLSTAYAWRDVAPALAKAGLAVLIPDMRGYGDSDKPAGNGGYDARSLAQECRGLVKAIGFGHGHCGGKVLPRHAGRVRRVRDQSAPRAAVARHRQGCRRVQRPAAFDRGLAVRELKAQGMRPVDIAKALKIGRASVYRVPGQPPTAESA